MTESCQYQKLGVNVKVLKINYEVMFSGKQTMKVSLSNGKKKKTKKKLRI